MQIQAQTVSCCHPTIISRDGGQQVELDQERAVKTRLVGLESRLTSTFAGLGLGLQQKGLAIETARLGLEKICNQVHFQFSLCTFGVLCLGCMTFYQPISHTQPKISVILTVACSAACSSSVNKG